MSNQGARQASVRAVTGTEYTYNGDWMALFDLSGIPAGDFNGRFLAWLNTKIPVAKTNLPDAMASYAINVAGVSCWNEVREIGGLPPPFSPADVPGLQLWLDASDTSTITQVAGSVSQWADKSGNVYNAVQATGASQPITGANSVNGKNVLSFDGTNDYLILPSGLYNLTNGPNTVLVVAQNTISNLTSGSARRLTQGKNSGGMTVFGTLSLPQTSSFTYRSGTTTGAMAGFVNDLNLHVWGGRRSGSDINSFYDGLLSSASNASDMVLTEMTIGHDVAGATNQAWGGYVCEVLMYDRALSSAEINQINSEYFTPKWGSSWSPMS